MTLNRIILLILATVLVIIIYSLPRVVVENKKEKVELSEPIQTGEEHTKIEKPVPDSIRLAIRGLKESLENSNSIEKRIIFADSLANAFRDVLFYDSAAYYLGIAADESGTLERYKIAGDAYFDAFNFTVSASGRSNFGEKARFYYQKILDVEPDNLDVKANLAVTYVTSGTPMKGIGMLREILEEDPTHEKALFNLGLLSITSGQLDKAMERFSTLLENYPDNYEARLYLGYCYMELQQSDDAKNEFQKIISSDADENIKTAASGYLESINK